PQAVFSRALLAVVMTDRMWLVALERQLDLLLPLTGAGAGFLAQRIPAMRAADTGCVMFRLAILNGNRSTARVALLEIALAQIVAHGHPVVEHIAVAAPASFFLGHLLQVFEDAALEVINLLEALAQHVAGGFLTADAAGAEHGHLLVFRRVVMRLDVLGKLAKGLGLRIDRAFE